MSECALTLFVGPEGGFSEAEIALARGQAGRSTVSLGPRILRTETAGPHPGRRPRPLPPAPTRSWEQADVTRPIFFLTDFGLTDTYVGIVKAVILGIAPDARIVDLTHDVPPQDVRAGAFALLTAAPYLPADAVVLAVVDPGVGTARRPIAVQVGGRTFVGPDNGLLSWVLGRSP